MSKDFIGIYENIYSEEFCKRTIEYYENLANAGFGCKRKPNENIVPLSKQDETVFAIDEPIIGLSGTKELFAEFNSTFWGIGYNLYAEDFSSLKSFEAHNIFAARVQKTTIGGGYHAWHCEDSSRETSNRILAWTVYLNDVDEGGETEFLYQHLRLKPKQGTLAIWPSGFTHTHRGNPPLSNTKYIITGWVEF
jgi:hypothetical protein